MAVFSGLVFNPNVYLTGDAGQEVSGFGWDGKHHQNKPPEKIIRKWERAHELINRVVDSFDETPIKREQLKPAIEEIQSLSLQEIPLPDFTFTEAQILEIQKIIAMKLRSIKAQQEDELILLLFAAEIL